jgi:type I restriction enzyme M protein
LNSSGLVHASNTMRAGALKVRLTTSSRSDFRSTVVLFFNKGAPTRSIFYYQLDPGRSLGKTNPLNDADLAEFIALHKTRASSPKSWTLDVADVDQATCDLSVKNPHAPEAALQRSPQQIIEDMLARDAETARLLAKVREML